MRFQVLDHSGGILEFVYPENPTDADVRDYVTEVRRRIDQQKGPWCCLVDQRKLPVMPPEFVDQVKVLNAYASRRGMRRTARLVTSAVASLQATRFARELHIADNLRVFTSRDEALAWLREPAA